MPNSSVVPSPNSAEIAWQEDATGAAGGSNNNDTDTDISSSSSSASFEDSSEPGAIKVICASSTSCTSSSSSSTQNETRIVRKMKSEKERLRLELLKQIKSLDHMKCFPKVLCGLSVDSSKSSSGIDSHLVRSYIQLMRTAKPEDDSSEESKPSIDSTKDALSLFLMKSGILPSSAKKKRKKDKNASISASSSEEDEEDEEDDDPLSLEDQQTIPYKSSIERKNEQLKEFLKLSKRKLAISDDDRDSDGLLDLDSFISSRNHTSSYSINPLLEFSHQKGYTTNTRPVLYMSAGGQTNGESSSSGTTGTGGGGESETTSTITGQIGSLVSSWVPWVSLSFGADSFEKDPFFSGGAKSKKTTSDSTAAEQSQNEAWKKEFDKLTYFMKLKKEIDRTKAKFKKRKLGRMDVDDDDESFVNINGEVHYGDDMAHEQIAPGRVGQVNDYADYYEDDYITNGRLSRDLKASSTDSEMVVYSTAVEIGKKLKDPRQCDYLYNGCPVPYSELLKIITSIRKDIKEEDETVEMLSKDMEDYLPSKAKLTAALKQSLSSQKTSATATATSAKNKKKTTQLNLSTRNKIHQSKKQQQQMKYNNAQHLLLHNGNNKLNGKNKKKQNTLNQQQQQQQQKSPITKISHILPNGEKVEINVQLSGSPSGDNTYSVTGDEQFDQEADVEIGDGTEYLAGEENDEVEESLFDEENDENTLSQSQIDPNISSPEDPAISASYELDDEKQDGDDFRKPTPLEIFNKISLKGAHEQISTTTTTKAPKPKYKVANNQKQRPRPQPSTRRPAAAAGSATKRPKPKPKPTVASMKPIPSTTEKKPIWSKGTTTTTKRPAKRPSTVRTARPTPRSPPPVNKLKPLMQSYNFQPSSSSFSIEDDEKSMESNIMSKQTSKKPILTKSKPYATTAKPAVAASVVNKKPNTNTNNKLKVSNKKTMITSSQKRNDTSNKTSQLSNSSNKRTPTTRTTQKPKRTTITSLSPSSPPKKTNKTSVISSKKKPETKTPTTTKRPTTTKKPVTTSNSNKSPVSTTPRYKVSKTTNPASSTGNKNETKVNAFPTNSSSKNISSSTKTKNTNSSSSTKKPQASVVKVEVGALTKSTKSPHLKEKPDNRKPISTTPVTTPTAPTTTLAPLAMFTKSVMDDVIQEFYHKKHINYAIPPSESPDETPAGAGNLINGQKTKKKMQHSQKIGNNNGIRESQLVQIGTEGTSPTVEGDEMSFISIETDEASGELKLHSGNKIKKDQLGSETGNLSESTNANNAGADAITSSSSSSSSESSNKKRIKYKNPKLPHLVILNSSTLDHPHPIALSDESSGVPIGSRNKPQPSTNSKSKSPGYSISNKKPTTPGSNPLDLPPYVFQPDSAEYPYWVPPPSL